MNIYNSRKQAIFNKILNYGITNNEWKVKRMTGIIIKFKPTDEELEIGLKQIKNGVDRYLVNSLEGYTFKTFNESLKKGINENE